jgi:2-C-methyl-D-erythritol 4-phosphate cytidylyltransferase
MTSPPRCFALVPCAGIGARSGASGPKQYAVIAGQSVAAHTLAVLQGVSRLAGVLVVLSPEDRQFEAAVPKFSGWVARSGGATRAATVAAGLLALTARGAHTDDWVLVHDAARCLVQPADVEQLIAQCKDDAVGGLLALPLADTLKDSDAQGRSVATIDRRGKWLAQTPQMFRLGLLAEALAKAGDGVTDEASAVEALGLRPKLVEGDVDNFKLTWPADFARAERVLNQRKKP